MANQQQKRRRKRYAPGSSYAGDVKPTGVLGFLGGTRMIQIIFIIMALALAAGGLVGILSRNQSTNTTTQNDNFAFPDDSETPSATGEPDDVVVKSFPDAPEMTIDTGKQYVAIIQTELGDIRVELFAAEAPATVNNFVFLAGEDFYDGLTFHYVEQGFTANAGDPACTAGNATCRGDGGPGYELDQAPAGPFETGTLGMINGSQFFIALTGSDAVKSQFEAEATAFGQVVSGLDVAEQLSVRDTIESIKIEVD
jgi:cyclophilin family peptidyl-prolyl cis-trans isomerase